MKVLYFGTVCDLEGYEQTVKRCKTKPTIATIVFESALLEGFRQNGLELDVFSTPMIPNFRHSKLLYWGRRRETLKCGYSCTWLRTMNVLFFKQITRRLDGRRVLKKWLLENRGEDLVVLTYGISPYLSKDILSLCRKYGARNCAIVPDLPRDMFMNLPKNSLGARLKQRYLKSTIRMQGKFDGYVYLTDAMSTEVNPNKPYVVMEGILNPLCVSEDHAEQKSSPRGIMYAGMLHEKYGILNLVDAFEAAKIADTELWLFGNGTAVEAIRAREAKNPRIRYFGSVTHDEILTYERQASLLVNPRSSKEQFTKYSFPSKTIEYMASGTPLLTTRLEGIPTEYFDYVFSVEDNGVMQLKNALLEIFSLSDEELSRRGKAAKQFILEHKNAKKQSRRVIDFLAANMGSKS